MMKVQLVPQVLFLAALGLAGAIRRDVTEHAKVHSTAGNPPTFGGHILEARKREYTRLVGQAAAWVSAAIPKLADPTLRTTWLGNRSPPLAKEFLNSVHKCLNNLYIERGVGDEFFCHWGTMAHINMKITGTPNTQMQECKQGCGRMHHDKFRVVICEAMWGQSEEFFTHSLIHECAHHFGAKDALSGGYPVNGYKESKQFAQEDPANAAENADNYAFFVYGAMAKEGLADPLKALQLPKVNDMAGLSSEERCRLVISNADTTKTCQPGYVVGGITISECPQCKAGNQLQPPRAQQPTQQLAQQPVQWPGSAGVPICNQSFQQFCASNPTFVIRDTLQVPFCQCAGK